MSKSYIPTLDGIRAIAFMLVYVAHAGLGDFVPGGMGVTIFFFLSGYLITTILRQEAQKTETISLKYFYLRRAFRILPPMLLTVGLAYLVGAFGVLSYGGNALGLVSALAYFYNYAELVHLHALLPSGNEVLWSLMVEEHFYFVFPLLYLTFLRRGIARRTQGNILLGLCFAGFLWRCCLVYFFHTSLTSVHRWTYIASDARFDSILFGCVLAIRNNSWIGDRSTFFERYKGLLASLGLVLLLVSLVIREPHFRETLRYSLQGIALYALFYYCISSSEKWQVSWLEWKPLRWLGWISYSMYLIHLILLGIGYHRFPQSLYLMPIVVFVLSIGYSWLMRVFVEEPSRRMRSRIEHRPQSAIHKPA